MGYRTMQGKEIDMEKLMRQHELMPAIGNMKVNARGDELGSGGKIIRRREEVVADYYEDNPNAKVVAPSKPVVERQVVEQPVVQATTKIKRTQSEE